MATEDLSNLKINMLTKAQFDAALAAGNINEDEIYNTIDEIDEDNGNGGIGIELVVITDVGATVYYKYKGGVSKIGGVADDNVFNTVELYFDGLIDKKEALKRLRYEKPNLQDCFRTAQALKHLHFLRSEQV